MFEQDYIMRIIRQMIRMVVMILFHYDIDKEESEIYAQSEHQDFLETLFDLVDAGQINEAENHIYDLTDGGDKGALETALLFYHYLNEKDNGFLEMHDFSREEVRQGVERVISLYGLEGMTAAFREQ